MKLLNRIRIFLFFDSKAKRLFMEAFILLGWAHIMKARPFSKVAFYLGEHMGETSFTLIEADRKLIIQIAQAINIMSNFTFWDSMCLEKAIAAMKMLERRNIDSTIYLGTAKDETGKMIAHAWLRSGPYYLTGAAEMNRFVVVSKFAKKIRG